ncbi:MAG: type IV secretory system conjugative DNA transfer family protein [Bifidobacteriaceae bacterium]|jgi:type IV secretion system protein VirD4|nr:type IV secretory system conjugative DNA transfer family protein [Bifidobacteriaceae bacterium]MCI1914408.1 type IV secretory system conjugative DNA transfer family protein [Bifidobacteriaceae bacterium]MCI1935860.1 type IV secretory system conjugative DNA transfer family protein [Bifidobacteriaceae bacterium]
MKKKTNPAAIAVTTLLGAWAGNLISRSVRTDLATGHDLAHAIDHALDGLYHPLRLSGNQTDLLTALCCAAIIGLMWAYAITNRRNYREGEEHGSAEWADAADMAPYTDHDPARNLQMTQTEGLSLDTKATHRNLNVAVIGSSGSRKTRGYVFPNIEKALMSYAITDPKGEIYRRTSNMLEEKGYQVRRLDLVDLSHSAHFNPMSYIDPDVPEPSIMRLVENLITNTDGGNKNSSSSDPFWTKAERALLTALTTWVYYTSDQPSLNDVVEMTGKLEASEENEDLMSEVDAMMEAAREMITEIRGHEDEWDEEVQHIVDGLQFAASQYRTFTQGAGETKKSIIISAGVRLAPLQVRQVHDIIADDDIDLRSIGSRKTAIFLILSDTDATFNFLAAIFYQCLFETTIYTADHNESGELQVPLHCFLDEFANIGTIPGFERLIATIRSRGISVSVIIQNIAQLKAKYKDSWETILGNCDSTLFLGGGEASTTELVSKRLGKQTIDTRDTSESKGMNGSFTISYRTAARDLLDPSELSKLDDKDCVYMLRGLNPFLSKKIDGKPIKPPKSHLGKTPRTTR